MSRDECQEAGRRLKSLFTCQDRPEIRGCIWQYDFLCSFSARLECALCSFPSKKNFHWIVTRHRQHSKRLVSIPQPPTASKWLLPSLQSSISIMHPQLQRAQKLARVALPPRARDPSRLSIPSASGPKMPFQPMLRFKSFRPGI